MNDRQLEQELKALAGKVRLPQEVRESIEVEILKEREIRNPSQPGASSQGDTSYGAGPHPLGLPPHSWAWRFSADLGRATLAQPQQAQTTPSCCAHTPRACRRGTGAF